MQLLELVRPLVVQLELMRPLVVLLFGRRPLGGLLPRLSKSVQVEVP